MPGCSRPGVFAATLPGKKIVLKKFAYGVVGIALACVSAFFGSVVLYIARSEVWPAIQKGTLDVETSSMVLNVLWEGNEIYLLLLGYLLMAAGFAIAAFRALKAAIVKK